MLDFCIPTKEGPARNASTAGLSSDPNEAVAREKYEQGSFIAMFQSYCEPTSSAPREEKHIVSLDGSIAGAESVSRSVVIADSRAEVQPPSYAAIFSSGNRQTISLESREAPCVGGQRDAVGPNRVSHSIEREVSLESARASLDPSRRTSFENNRSSFKPPQRYSWDQGAEELRQQRRERLEEDLNGNLVPKVMKKAPSSLSQARQFEQLSKEVCTEETEKARARRIKEASNERKAKESRAMRHSGDYRVRHVKSSTTPAAKGYKTLVEGKEISPFHSLMENLRRGLGGGQS